MAQSRRVDLGCRRIQRILRRLGVASMRTLEQKISDAGPPDHRVDPHNLGAARKLLERSGLVVRVESPNGPWYHLSATPEAAWKARLALLEPIRTELHSGKNNVRVGQALEIAVFRALVSEQALHGMAFYGGFPDLNPSDEITWNKSEPTMISGRSLAGDRNLDFALFHPDAGRAGIEVKNRREWIYPDSEEVLELLAKCCELDAVPVLICRRYAYVTYSVLHRCGVLLHQNYNQLLPESMRDVAEQAKDKDLLGYHDIRLGTEPDSRLRRFLGSKLGSLLPKARERFDRYHDLLCAFATREMDYVEFAARARRREDGMPEDFDHDGGHEFDYY